jgi:hypothetical protein
MLKTGQSGYYCIWQRRSTKRNQRSRKEGDEGIFREIKAGHGMACLTGNRRGVRKTINPRGS